MSTYYLYRAEGESWVSINVLDTAESAARAFVRCTGDDLDPEAIACDLDCGTMVERMHPAGDVYAVVRGDSPLRRVMLAGGQLQ